MATRQLDIRWIAPVPPKLPKLNWIDELGGIAQIRGVNLKTLVGPAATMDAISEFLSEPGVDLLIWSGHGKEDCLVSTDDKEMDAEWIAAYASGSGAEAFVVGACYSGARGGSLQSITEEVGSVGIHTLGFSAAADDKAAATLAIQFTRAMLVTDVYQAGRLAIKACAKIDLETARSVVTASASSRSQRKIIEELKKVKENTESLGVRVARVERTQEEILQRVDCISEPRVRRSRGVVKPVVVDRPV